MSFFKLTPAQSKALKRGLRAKKSKKYARKLDRQASKYYKVRHY